MSTLRARPTLWINLSLAAVLVVAGAVALVALRSAPGVAQTAARTAAVRTGSVTTTVSGSGNVTSADAVAAGFQTGGTVTSIRVKAGQRVDKGQVLATLDPATARRTLDSAKAQLASCLQAAGIAAPTPTGPRPSFTRTPGQPRPSGVRPSGAGRGLFSNPKVQAALKACGITPPSPGSFRRPSGSAGTPTP